jgi:ABC-2 type transport system permease protein
MKEFLKAYVQTFKDIVSNSSVFTTLILSVILYSFFYPTAYKAERAESIPIVIVDEEQSLLTSQVIGQTAIARTLKLLMSLVIFLKLNKWFANKKPMVFYFYQQFNTELTAEKLVESAYT